MLGTRWINNNEDYKSNTGSNYASQSYHNDIAKAYGYACALQLQLRVEIESLDLEIQIKNRKVTKNENN